jgi:DNA-directed RNA polymerase subunit E'/Rpb7
MKEQLYAPNFVTHKIVLPFTDIGKNIYRTLEQCLEKFEGKCNKEGYVKPRSTRIISHSSGTITDNGMVAFQVMYEYLSCNPVEGMIIRCVAKTITKAGIHAHLKEEPTPMVIFIARDHHHTSPEFSKIKTGDELVVKIIGRHFELNDSAVYVIAEMDVKN